MGSSFIHKAKLFILGRRNVIKNIRKDVKQNREDKKIIWIHCASVGEFEQARPIIELIKKDYKKEYKIFLTFFSPSGYELRKDYDLADWIYYLPIDGFINAHRFLRVVKPDIAIFIKYEYWYYYLTTLKRKHIPTYMVSATFRPSQIFFKKTGGLYRKMLRTFKTIFVQDEVSKRLLKRINITNVVVAGDTRFDRVCKLSTQPRTPNKIVETFKGNKLIFVAGSTWEQDEYNLAEALKAFHYLPKENQGIICEAKAIIVPHEVTPQRIAKCKEIFRLFSPILYSECEKGKAYTDTHLDKAQILIVDKVGFLSSLYPYGSFAYIGGGFGAGIHNILEAATYGRPTIFGPNYRKFREARELIRLGGAFSYYFPTDLRAKIADWFITCCNEGSDLSKICTQYIEDKRGASKIIVKAILESEK
ncbi:MAG: glycosyltransferase N-terminal domain-containing protein [Bacteroidales bacterium]